MFWDKKENIADFNKVVKSKGKITIYSGKIVSEGDMVKKKKKHKTIKLQSGTKKVEIVFEAEKPQVLSVGWKGSIAVSEEIATISTLKKWWKKPDSVKESAGSKIKGKLKIADIDGSNGITIEQQVSLNDVYVRVNEKIPYNKFQCIIGSD